MNVNARCDEPATESNARGAQNAPRARNAPRPGTLFDAPIVASYDPETGQLRWGSKIDPRLAPAGSVSLPANGEESWKWLFLQPLTPSQE